MFRSGHAKTRTRYGGGLLGPREALSYKLLPVDLYPLEKF